MLVFFFNDTATTEIYTLSLHDALPISVLVAHEEVEPAAVDRGAGDEVDLGRGQLEEVLEHVAAVAQLAGDRKSTRLNSSHANISYAVFCLKKKKTTNLLASFNLYTLYH